MADDGADADAGDRENADPNRCSTAGAPPPPEDTAGVWLVPLPTLRLPQLAASTRSGA